jgi:hypothetical protein
MDWRVMAGSSEHLTRKLRGLEEKTSEAFV